MRKLIALISSILIYTTITVNAQNRSDLYDQVADWSREDNATAIINAHEAQADINFQADSLSWYFYYVAHAYIQVGDYNRSEEIVDRQFNRMTQIESEDLKLRLMLTRSLLLKKRNQYQESITALNQALPIVKTRIVKFKEEGNYKRAAEEMEKLTTIYINKSTNYFYLGNIEKYGDLTIKALKIARDNQNHRQEFLARRNLIEYYEITENWEEATLHLQAYSEDIKIYGDERESARYKLRTAIYKRDKIKDTDEADKLLQEVLSVTQKIRAFQIWEEALYELLHTYIVNKKYDEARELVDDHLQNDNVLNNINTLSLLRARSLQLHIYRNNWEAAEKDYKALQIINTNLSDSQVQSVATHAIIMYLTKTKDYYTARLLLKQLVEKITNHQSAQSAKSAIANQKSLEYILMQHYNRIKYQHSGAPLSNEEIIDQLMKMYQANQIHEWWYKAKSSLKPLFILIPGFIVLTFGILIMMKLKERYPEYLTNKTLGSEPYQSLRSRIHHI